MGNIFIIIWFLKLFHEAYENNQGKSIPFYEVLEII